jgi:hypothetical protein
LRDSFGARIGKSALKALKVFTAIEAFLVLEASDWIGEVSKNLPEPKEFRRLRAFKPAFKP